VLHQISASGLAHQRQQRALLVAARKRFHPAGGRAADVKFFDPLLGQRAHLLALDKQPAAAFQQGEVLADRQARGSSPSSRRAAGRYATPASM
jgi:hypothetical protein